MTAPSWRLRRGRLRGHLQPHHRSGDTRSLEVEATEVTLPGVPGVGDGGAGRPVQYSTVQYSTVQYSEDEAKLTFVTLPEAGGAARLQPLVEAGTEEALVG